MNKSNKIRRYQRKDYTAVVEFPVEIIGRDGVVRRYSFEESIRLYQRRIATADIRYNDREIIKAEKKHCFHRIEQLRRSFFAHHGWPAVEVVDEDGCTRLLAAEVAAFLRRCLAPVDPRPELFTFSRLEQGDHHNVYFVQPPAEAAGIDALVEGHFLLYVFQFEATGSSPSREAFFDLIKILDGVKLSAHSAVESLVAFFHTHDCGLILTGSGNVVSMVHDIDLAQVEALSWAPEAIERDEVEAGMRLLAQGRLEGALEAFVKAYTEQHFRRVGYLGAAVVADQLCYDGEAETATVMGCRYFPGDPAMIYHRALNLLRNADYAAARERLEQILDWPHGRGAVRFLMALCLLADGHQFRGQALLRSLKGHTFRLDPHLAKGVRWVRAQIWARNLLLFAAAFIACTGAFGLVNGSPWHAGGLVLVGLVVGRMVVQSWHRQLVLQLSGPSDRRMRLSSSAVLISDEGGSPLQ